MVQVPGTQLDTNTQNPQDKRAITDILARDQLTDQNLRTFVTQLVALQHWTDYERNIFTGTFPLLMRRDDANDIYLRASGHMQGQQQGVWCKGRVIFNNQQYGTETPAVRAAIANAAIAQNCAYYNPGVSPAELDSTKNDGEILVLEDINNLVTGPNWPTLQHLRIFLTGSQGPCGVCRRRIRAFLTDLNRLAANAHRQIPFYFQANYTTIYQPNVNQGNIQTQYGYPDATTIQVATGQPGAYSFWSKAFECILGDFSDQNFRTLLETTNQM